MLCWELGSPLDIGSAGLGFPVWFGGKHQKTIILRTTRTEYENREDATSFEEYRTSENFNTIPFLLLDLPVIQIQKAQHIILHFKYVFCS